MAQPVVIGDPASAVGTLGHAIGLPRGLGRSCKGPARRSIAGCPGPIIAANVELVAAHSNDCALWLSDRVLRSVLVRSFQRPPLTAPPECCRGCGPLLLNVGANGDVDGPRPNAGPRRSLKRRAMLDIIPVCSLCTGSAWR